MTRVSYALAVLAVSCLAVPAAPAWAQSARTIEIVGTDDLKFDVTRIEAKPGERLRIVLRTVSRMPKIAMAHNFVLLNQGTDVQAFINQSAMARDNDFVAPAMKDRVLADSGLAGGGETVEVTFEAPKTPGEYIYVCSFPGHYAGGMLGTLIVK